MRKNFALKTVFVFALVAAATLISCEKDSTYQYSTPKDNIGQDTLTYVNNLKTKGYVYNSSFSENGKSAYYLSSTGSLIRFTWEDTDGTATIKSICTATTSGTTIPTESCYY